MRAPNGKKETAEERRLRVGAPGCKTVELAPFKFLIVFNVQTSMYCTSRALCHLPYSSVFIYMSASTVRSNIESGIVERSVSLYV